MSMKDKIMDIAFVSGVIALTVVGASVWFIARGTDMPDWWSAVVVSTIIARLFGDRNSKNGNGNGNGAH